MREKLLFVSLILFIAAVVFYTFTFFIFHYMGEDNKFHRDFHKEVRKPFVAKLFGTFATVTFANSVMILVIALIVY